MRKLSIIIPAYNAEKYLPECIDKMKEIGILNRPEIKIILVNDGSKDGTKEICDNYKSEYSDLLVLHKRNEGVSVARNTGMELATGEYLMFLDADDYLDQENWKYVEQFLDSTEYRDFVAFAYRTLYADGRVQEELLPMHQETTDDLQRTRLYTYASSRFNACWGKLFRRDIIESSGLKFIPGMKIGEDAMFVMEYVLHCTSSRIINRPILYYRQIPESAMHQHTIRQKLEDFKTLFQYRKQIVLVSDPIYVSMCREHFSVVTNLMLQSAGTLNGKELREEYRAFLKEELVAQIITEVKPDTLRPVYKKVEYILMKKKMVRGLAYYFSLKARRGGSK